MPPDLVPLFGSQYFTSQLYMTYPQYGNIQCAGGCGTGGSSAYDGFLLNVEKRFSQGLQFKLAYTVQKTMVDAGIGGYYALSFTGGAGYHEARGRQFQLGALSGTDSSTWAEDPDNWKGDRALSGDDIPQILNAAWTYELPFGSGKAFAGHVNGFSRLLIEG